MFNKLGHFTNILKTFINSIFIFKIFLFQIIIFVILCVTFCKIMLQTFHPRVSIAAPVALT